MAQYNLTVEQKRLSANSYKDFSSEDSNLLEAFVLNSSFKPSKHFVELHIYSIGNTLLRSISSYDNYSIQGGEDTADGSSDLYIDPIADSKAYGYINGGVQLQYVPLNNLFSETKFNAKLFIKEISNDRTELKLDSLGITPEDLEKFALKLKDEINNNSSFSGFRLNLGNNILCIGLNVDYLDEEKCVTVKLYEPLPSDYGTKSTLDIVEYISAPLVYEIDSEFIPDQPIVPRLREANFNVDIDENTSTPSQYFNFDELFSFKVENKNYQLLSLFNEKGAEISIDHSDYADFIHFSSAEERLVNFKYKLELIQNYESSIANVSSDIGSSGVTSNTTYYRDLLKGVVDNFDHYERFLYFESGSYSWPKSNNTKPYENQLSSTAEAVTWFTDQRTIANNYDVSNFNTLTNTIPTFIREDDNNDAYVLFVQMLGQHFDNLYIYAKAVSDKYDADNRINVGVSRDLVEEAIKSLGVKLYNSSRSLENLFKFFIDESEGDTSEVIENEVTAGTVISGGTTVEGPNQGFEYLHNNIFRFVNMPGLNPAYQGAFIMFQLTTPNPTISSGFNDQYFYENIGGEVFITITDVSNTVHGPFKYIIAEDLTPLTITTGRISMNPNSTNVLTIHPTDAENESHSALFTNLFSQINVIDIKIEDKRVTSSPLVTKPIEKISQDIYQKTIYKRIYHNLPFLLKTKGTQRGLRALINCFGIPSNILDIKTYGGRKTSEKPFFGDSEPYILSNDKVRTDNTGSLIEGDTLSRFASIIKNDDTYNQDLHNIEVGFSPSDNLDVLIKDTLNTDFSIDDYIGDPRDLTLENYNELLSITKTALADITSRYNIKDFVRLIKFFDNVVFKMIKDFVPARSTTDTGIIIKPHLLDKSKAKSVSVSVTQPEYSGSIDTAFITGSNPGAYLSSASGSLRFDDLFAKMRADLLIGTKGESSTRRVEIYKKIIKTPLSDFKIKQYKDFTDHGQDEAKFDGELAGSRIVVSTGELNDENLLKKIKYPNINYDVVFFKDIPSTICAITDVNETIIIGRKPDSPFTGEEAKTITIYGTLFSIHTGGTNYFGPAPLVEGLEFNSNNEVTNSSEAVLVENSGFGTSNTITIPAGVDNNPFEQYEVFTVTGFNSELQSGDTSLALYPSCASTRTFKVVRCRLETNTAAANNPVPGSVVDITQWFSGLDVNTDVEYFVDGSLISDPENYEIQEGDTVFTVKDLNDEDNCFATHVVTAAGCGLDGLPEGVSTLNQETGLLRYDISSFFFGVDPQLYQFEYAIKFLDNLGNPFYSQDINSYLDQSQSGFTFINDNVQGDEWIEVPQGGNILNNFPVFQQQALLAVFDTLDFEDPQEPGYQSIGTAKSVLFRVRVLELGVGCKHETTIPSQLFVTRQIGDKNGPTPRTINLNRGTLCQACGVAKGGEIVEAHYMALSDLTFEQIVDNKVRLFKTENDAQNNTLSEQIDSGRYGPTTRRVLDAIITYYYNSSDQRTSVDPWSGSQQEPIECSEPVIQKCFEADNNILDRARYDER